MRNWRSTETDIGFFWLVIGVSLLMVGLYEWQHTEPAHVEGAATVTVIEKPESFAICYIDKNGDFQQTSMGQLLERLQRIEAKLDQLLAQEGVRFAGWGH